jgi:hypothetical protein
MYHFSGPIESIKPAEELELSLPLRCLPLVKGVDVPGGDIDRLGFPLGEEVPGDLERGGAYRDVGLVKDVEVGFVGEETVCGWLSEVALVVIVLVEAAFVVLVETWAVDTSEDGEIPVPLDLAW